MRKTETKDFCRRTKFHRLSVFYPLILLGTALTIHWSHYFDSDEGVLLNGAWHLLKGKALYLDFFEYIAPGGFYLVLWIWKITGPNFWSAKLLGILSVFAAALGIFFISRFFARGVSTYFFPFVFILGTHAWPVINHNTFALPLLVWATWFWLLSMQHQRKIFLILGGFSGGLSALFLQHKGGIFLVAVATYILLANRQKGKWRNCFLFLIAGLAPLFLLLKWSPSLLLENLFLFPLQHYIEINVLSFNLFFLTIIFFLPFILVINLRERLSTLPLIYLQAVLLVMALQRPDYYHITSILFPCLALLPKAWEDFIGNSRFTPKGFALFLSVAYFCSFLTIYGLLSLWLYPPMVDKSESWPVRDFVEKDCGDSHYIYAGPFSPGLYFELKKENPSPFSILLTGLNPMGHFIIAKEELVKRCPPCAVVNYSMVEKFNFNQDNPVDRFIQNNYRIAFRHKGIEVYVLQSKGICSDAK